MRFANNSSRYGAVSMAFHWLMAVMILSLLAVGLYMENLPAGPDKLQLYGLHKAFGSIVLVLAVLRVLWRTVNPPPPLSSGFSHSIAILAHTSHFVMYVLIFCMPLSGWMMSSAAGYPVSVFGWFALPDLIGPDPALKSLFGETHEWCAYALMGMLILHTGAALWHHFILKDDTLRRMLPALLPALLTLPGMMLSSI